jgi:hypothetical protein
MRALAVRWTVVVPVQAFVPLRLKVPAPSLARPPAPWIALLMGRVVPESTWNESVPMAARTSWAQYFRRYWHYGFYRCHRIFEDHGAVGPKGVGERHADVQGSSLTATAPVKGLVALTVPVPVLVRDPT